MAGNLVLFQAKVSQETFDTLINAFNMGEFTTKNQFLEVVIEAYLNPKIQIKEVVSPELEAQLQNLQNEVGLLKTANTLLDQRNMELENLVRQAKMDQADGFNLQENQIVLNILRPEIKPFLAKEKEAASRKYKQEISDDIIMNSHLLNMFENGCSYSYYTWDASERAKLKKEQKNQAAELTTESAQ